MELVINDRIRNRKVEFFNDININLQYNSVASTFSLDFYFDPTVIEQKEMACVGHYHICQLFHEGNLLLTGYIISQGFSDTPTRKLMAISGYSLPGVLEDCNIPTNEAIDAAIANGNLKIKKGTPTPYCYPIQDEGLTLLEIAKKYLSPFQIEIVVDPAIEKFMNQPIPDTSASPKDSIKGYLTELATQKAINITHDKFGRIVFTKARTDLRPLMEFNVPKGGLPGIKMDLKFNGQPMHSQITVMKQSDLDDPNAGEATVTNPFVPFVFRPKTIIQSSGSDIDTELAARQARAEELRNLSVTVSIDRWNVDVKTLFRPDNTITIINPEIYLYKKSTWYIESVNYKGNQKEMTATLNCVIPEVYNGREPAYLFKGINLH